MSNPKPCQRCQKSPCAIGLRFCASCAADVEIEMVESGYLEEVGDEDDAASEPAVAVALGEQWRDAWQEYAAGPESFGDEAIVPDVVDDDSCEPDAE